MENIAFGCLIISVTFCDMEEEDIMEEWLKETKKDIEKLSRSDYYYL